MLGVSQQLLDDSSDSSYTTWSQLGQNGWTDWHTYVCTCIYTCIHACIHSDRQIDQRREKHTSPLSPICSFSCTFGKNYPKQECILVGCVPTRVFLTETFLDTDPLDTDPSPDRDSPWTENSLGSQTGSDIIQRPSCGQNDRRVETLPCPKLRLRAVTIG